MAYSETIKLRIESQGFSDVTYKIEEIVKRSKVLDGICTVFSVGSTSAVLINENETMLVEDIKNSLEKVAPDSEIYNHSENARSHIRAALIGSSQSIPILDGKLVLGNWQSVLIANFDVDARDREVVVTIVE